MFSTAEKKSTLRWAVAQAVLRISPKLKTVLENRASPKGDPFEVARVAGVLAAKKTWELIPFCHPLPIDQITIDFQLEEAQVVVTSKVTAIWKTGVEMEALVSVQMAAAALFDMLKPVDTVMEIVSARILEKRGGKSDFREKIPENFRAAIIVTSDGTFAGKRSDRSGLIIRQVLEKNGVSVGSYLILPDEKEKILEALNQFLKEKYDLILTTGGTGLGPRDVTVEATRAFIEREVPGIMEAARAFGQARTPYAMLSRGLAGLKDNMLVVNLPGSSRGTEESLAAIFPAILHSYPMRGGGGH